jgi:hypothetical protein
MHLSPTIATADRPTGQPLRIAGAVGQALVVVLLLAGAAVVLPATLMAVAGALMAAFGVPTAR